jgi:hypothetical protein
VSIDNAHGQKQFSIAQTILTKSPMYLTNLLGTTLFRNLANMDNELKMYLEQNNLIKEKQLKHRSHAD